MLKSEVPALWPPDAKSHSLEKTLIQRKIEGKRRRGWKWIRWLDIITNEMNLSKLQGSLVCCSQWGHKELDLATEYNKQQCTNVYNHSVIVYICSKN